MYKQFAILHELKKVESKDVINTSKIREYENNVSYTKKNDEKNFLNYLGCLYV